MKWGTRKLFSVSGRIKIIIEHEQDKYIVHLLSFPHISFQMQNKIKFANIRISYVPVYLNDYVFVLNIKKPTATI